MPGVSGRLLAMYVAALLFALTRQGLAARSGNEIGALGKD